MDDRISQLPNDILSYILTMLSIKDLLKTSVLSKRWCKLWGLRKDLYFDIHNLLGSENELLETGYLIDDGYYKRVNLDFSQKEFVKRVDQFIKNFPGTAVDSLSVSFYLDCEQSNTVDQWIKFAIAKGVKRIDLLFLGSPYEHHCLNRDKYYKFDFALFLETNASTITHLGLEGCIVCYPTNYDFTPFKPLRSLSLNCVRVDEIFIEHLLSNCRFLEELCLHRCGFKSLAPRIVSSSLSHLKVLGSYVLYYESIPRYIDVTLVDCLNLTSLDFWGNDLSTSNIHAHVLKRINFSVLMEKLLDAFALCATFPELEIMRLEIFYTSTMVTTSLKTTQPLKHLKQLECAIDLSLADECDLMVVLNILQASPLLQKLSVMIKAPKHFEEQEDIRDIEGFSHDEIKVIEFRGCVGNWFEIEFVMNVLKYAHKLEQIVVSPYWTCDYSLDRKSNPVWFQSGRERMIEKLQSEEIVGREKCVLI